MRYALLLSTILLSSTASAMPFRQFDLPGVASTCGTAIASNGVVAGVGATPSATPPTLGQTTPFILHGRTFSIPTINLPAGFIYLAGINRGQTLVGFDLLSSSVSSTDFKFAHGTLTTLTLGEPVAINDSGTVLSIGTRQPPLQFSFNQIAVLQTRAGKLTQLDDGTGDMVPSGMDEAADRVVGHSITADGWQAWSWHQGVFTPVTVPNALPGANPTGVDARGRIVGTYATGTIASPVAHGFIQTAGVTASFDVPGATSTLISGTNEAGMITGCFTNAKGIHGFIAKP